MHGAYTDADLHLCIYLHSGLRMLNNTVMGCSTVEGRGWAITLFCCRFVRIHSKSDLKAVPEIVLPNLSFCKWENNWDSDKLRIVCLRSNHQVGAKNGLGLSSLIPILFYYPSMITHVEKNFKLHSHIDCRTLRKCLSSGYGKWVYALYLLEATKKLTNKRFLLLHVEKQFPPSFWSFFYSLELPEMLTQCSII